jgi:putative ATPase
MNQTLKEHKFPSGQVLQLAVGDITGEPVDAIVNAANSHLAHGAGVAGAIVRRGGPVIQAESNLWVREHGLVSHAQPAFTHAGTLPCHYVIHEVGPRWGEGNEDEKLAAAVSGSLQLAEQLAISSIALPALSTGIFGFPKERAARVIISAILEYLDNASNKSLKLIRLVLFDPGTVQAFIQEWEQNDHLAA